MRGGSVGCCATSALERTGFDAAAAIGASDRGELWLDGIKYLFVTAIEGCVDVAQHISSSERFPPPDTNAAVIRMLGDRHILDRLLADALGRAVGFRNVLVHQYVEVDDAIVMSSLDDVEQLHQFVAQVSAWVLSQTDR